MGRGKAGPYRKKGRGYWQAVVGGQLRRYDVETEKDARKAWREDVAAAGRLEPLPAPAAGGSFKSLAYAFLDHVEASGKSPNTYRSHRQRLLAFIKHVGPRTAAARIRPADLSGWFVARGWNPTTQGRAIESVKAAFNWAVREGLLQSNPVAHYRKPAARRRDHLWTRTELARACRLVPREFARWLLGLWYLGCRPAELTLRNGTDVGKGGAMLVIAKSKTGKPRTVIAPGRFRKRLARWARTAAAGPLFPAPEGGRLTDSARNRYWSRAKLQKRAGLPAGAIPNTLRHTWIHRHLTAGDLSIVEVSQMTGTSIIMLQRVYGHIERAPLDRIAARLAQE